jgi:DNA-binding HxlR family transcriptional regulator
MERWCDDAATVIAVISRKWSIPVLDALEAGPRRHNELHRAVGSGIHPTVLDSTLRRLEGAGLVKRDTQPGMPPATWYELTSLAQSLIDRLSELAGWADEHRAELALLSGWPKSIKKAAI